MFQQKYHPFVTAFQNLPLAVQARAKCAAYAIGYAAACNMALPSTEVDSHGDYYTANLESGVKTIVSNFNEQILIDCTVALEMARKFWMLRYEAVHRCPRMDQIEGDFFASVFGVERLFAPNDIKFLNENAKNINILYQRACEVVQAELTAEV